MKWKMRFLRQFSHHEMLNIDTDKKIYCEVGNDIVFMKIIISLVMSINL